MPASLWLQQSVLFWFFFKTSKPVVELPNPYNTCYIRTGVRGAGGQKGSKSQARKKSRARTTREQQCAVGGEEIFPEGRCVSRWISRFTSPWRSPDAALLKSSCKSRVCYELLYAKRSVCGVWPLPEEKKAGGWEIK